MTDIKVKPAEDKEEEDKEEIKKEEPEKKPNFLTTKESDYIISQFYQLISIYYSVNNLDESTIPKDSNFYMNEMLKILKSFHVIE